MSIAGESLVVYSVFFGEGEVQLSPPIGSHDVPWVLLTDREDISAPGWEIQRVRALLPGDSPRSSRFPKILAHRYFPEFDRSIYLDSKVRLKRSPEILWESITSCDSRVLFGGLLNSISANIRDEAETITRLGFDSPAAVEATLGYLTSCDAEYLNKSVVWGAILARRHNQDRLVSAMETWFAMVLRFSRRDQLSLPFALGELAPEEFALKKHDNRESEFHIWEKTKSIRRVSYRREPLVDVHGGNASSRDFLRSENLLLKKRVLELEQTVDDIRGAWGFRITRLIPKAWTKLFGKVLPHRPG